MKKVVKELLAIEQEQAQAQSKFGGSRARHKWSDVFSRRNGIYNLLLDVMKKTRSKRHRPQVRLVITTITRHSQILGIDLSDLLNYIPSEEAKEKEWKQYNAKLRGHLRGQQREMHCRRRTKWRLNMKKYKKEREEQRKKQYEVRKYYNYALRRPGQDAKPITLQIPLPSGEVEILDTKEDIHNKEIEITKKHMGEKRERWYINKGELFGVYADTSTGKKIRQQIQQGTLPEEEWRKIPEKIRGVLRCAEACKSKLTGTRMAADMYGSIACSAGIWYSVANMVFS